MVKVAWKVISGYGPYAYLQESVKDGGKVISKHLAYLGAAGKHGIVPGKHFNAPPAGEFPGGRILIPLVGDGTKDALKQKQKSLVQYMENHAQSGSSSKEIIAGAKNYAQALDKHLKETKQKETVEKVATEIAQGEPKLSVPVAWGAGSDAAAAKALPKVTTVPKSKGGQPLISKAVIKKLEAAAATGDPEKLQLVATGYHDLAKGNQKKFAVSDVYADLKDQMDAAAAAPKAPVQPPPKASPAADKPPPKLTVIPSGGPKGQPLISLTNVKKLEKAAATGDLQHLETVANGMSDKMKDPLKKGAIANAYAELKDEMQPAGPEGPGQADTEVASNKPPLNVPAAWGTPTETETAKALLKVTVHDTDPEGKSLLSQAIIKKLEAAAATGDQEALHATSLSMSQQENDPSKQWAIANAYLNLKNQMEKQGATAEDATADTAKAPPKATTIPKDEDSQPLVSQAMVEKLELAAATGNVKPLESYASDIHSQAKSEEEKFAVTDVYFDLKNQMEGNAASQPAADPGAAGNAPDDKTAAAAKLTETLKATAAAKGQGQGDSGTQPEPSTWTQLEPAKGSTQGGVYQDEKGEKYYIKCPGTPSHVRNELLARELYALAGVKVLEGREIEMDQKACLATPWEEGLAGSGTNPKGLKGTTEGFVADAWLANWDSVGVGSTKYDNILSLNGEAVRVDTGGALLYRGTGAPKGEKFGLEVTELEGLRDPTLNPVAATVYGDMTLEEIKASAAPVLAIPGPQIAAVVKKHFPDDAELADELKTKLLYRRNHIQAWLDQQGAQAELADDKGVSVEEAKQESVAPNPEAPTVNPTVGTVPKDNKGKALITATNVNKMEKVAASGDIDALKKVAGALADKMKSPAKKAAILNACAELKAQLQGTPVMEGDGGSGLADTMDKVDSGEVKLPDQEVPKAKVVEQQKEALKSGTKNYDADLEQVSGKKGSNEGGLFKDKKLETLHYIKWPNSPVRAKVETLTALLYAYAQVPVPIVRTVKFQNKDAVMSDWIDDAKPMTIEQMKAHEDVRTGFGVDCWLANWDVVGLQADNIVKGPGDKAYRIDLGGSILFRAQGKPKEFADDVPELEAMRSPSINAQAAKVFANMSKAEIKAAAQKVEAISDAQIDEAVDSVKLPKKSADYPASQFGAAANDLPKMLKSRLKDRRDFIVEELLRLEEAKEPTKGELQAATGLKPDSVDTIADTVAKYTSHAPPSTTKWENTKQVMVQELGKAKGASANSQARAHYKSWKGSSNSPKGSVLRWAAGELHGDGRKELARLGKFDEFLTKQGSMAKSTAESNKAFLANATTAKTAQNLVAGLWLTSKQNEIAHSLQNPGKEEITLYRGWKADQLKYLNATGLKVGDEFSLEDPPLYSWSTSPNIAKSFSGHHGSVVTKAKVPIDAIVLSDLVNSVGSYESETEVVFKGVPKQKMEVTQTY